MGGNCIARNENWRVTGFVHLHYLYLLGWKVSIRTAGKRPLKPQYSNKGWVQNWISWLESISSFRGENNDIPVVKCRVPHETHAGTCWPTFPGRIPSIEQTSWHFFFAMSSSSSSRSFSVKHRSRTRRVLGESSKAQTISIRGMSKICSLALLPKIFFVQGSSSFNLEGWRRRDERRERA